jgi:hypothetical protein
VTPGWLPLLAPSEGEAVPDDSADQGEIEPADGFAPGPLPMSGGFSLGALGTPAPVFVPSSSTPLEEDDSESPIPPAALWAMKYRRHLHLTLTRRDEDRLRACLGEGDGAVYVIDDGGKHNMVSRLVGIDEDGSTYCLVGRITGEAYDRCAIGESPLEGIFSQSRELSLCSVFAALEAVSNVLVVAEYATVDDVPSEYLPPHPFLEFRDDVSEDG